MLRGWPGFRVLDAREVAGGAELTVETTAAVAWWWGAGVEQGPLERARAPRGGVRPAGAAALGEAALALPRAGVLRGDVDREHAAIRRRRALTERARVWACRLVGRDARSVAAVARDLGACWHTTVSAVVDDGVPLVDDPARIAGVTALGVDETIFADAGPRRRTRFVSGLVDLRRSRLLDVVDGRASGAVTAWLEAREEAWLPAVERVALDPYRG